MSLFSRKRGWEDAWTVGFCPRGKDEWWYYIVRGDGLNLTAPWIYCSIPLPDPPVVKALPEFPAYYTTAQGAYSAGQAVANILWTTLR